MLKIACLINGLESNIVKSNRKSGEREKHSIIREKANSLIMPIDMIYERILESTKTDTSFSWI